MNIGGNAPRPSRSLGSKAHNSNNNNNKHSLDGTKTNDGGGGSLELSFYGKPPDCEMSLDEFEEFALSRLKVLRTIEELKTRNITGDAYRKALDKTISENLTPSETSIASSSGSSSSSSSMSKSKEKAKIKQLKKKLDIASHFILRAAYCKTEDLRRWFLTQETFLFRHQLEKLSDSSRNSRGLHRFLEENGLHYQMVEDGEKTALRPFLLQIPNFFTNSSHNNNTTAAASASTSNNTTSSDGGSNSTSNVSLPSIQEISTTTYFKIPFLEATDLIAHRQCYITNGYAYVPLRKIVTIITARFRINLSKSLAKASRIYGNIIHNNSGDYQQIAPLLDNMNAQYTGKDYNDAATKIGNGDYELTARNVDSYADSMPLCMSQLHSGLKADHKLRHHGRLQYGLFLKGAGMSMEESLLFLQKEFGKIMSAEKFTKEYSYNVRHMYGKEGKRTSYSPYPCKRIILGTPPNSGEHHGCPYKHYDEDHLASVLGKMKIGGQGDRDAILSLKKQGHYNLACQKHFEVTHPGARGLNNLDLNGVGEHPNSWYASSVAYKTAKAGSSAGVGVGDDNAEEKLEQ